METNRTMQHALAKGIHDEDYIKSWQDLRDYGSKACRAYYKGQGY
jgi:hypothetical protein